MADDLTPDERELLEKHRAEKAKTSRKVKIRGRDDKSGTEYEFDIEGDEADRVVSRHSHLWAEEEKADEKTAGKTPASAATAAKKTQYLQKSQA